MADLFGSPLIAAGYATSRPPIHPLLVKRMRDHLQLNGVVNRALDVGCGAGLSTKPLTQLAKHSVGIEPAPAMLPWAMKTAPQATFVVGRAEALPIRSQCADIITAAGSLNYADLDRFFPEASRVLVPGGVLIVYDFSAGKSFRGSSALDDWFAEFSARYPMPADESREINPASLAATHYELHLTAHERFEIGLTLSPEFYLNYALTETNVVHAIRNGLHLSEVREWCAGKLAPVFAGHDREVLFRGYIAYMS